MTLGIPRLKDIAKAATNIKTLDVGASCTISLSHHVLFKQSYTLITVAASSGT
ncbi:hypothetical protein PILCRDRAFT_815597 [Piloderma croceum F 1598]|uniref:Uncharacterized protein n=1 Tax=Piloderma croceum (strain F 1598) TaxID=765440 RepID=A0A0C3G5U0_PILCF|nr:hypothetical protein PILCRDRAFT_815597 [Piloderma croceum F 1598]